MTNWRSWGIPLDSNLPEPFINPERKPMKKGPRLFTPAQFRELRIPPEGLWWGEWFRCPKCLWERRHTSWCRYCDLPMNEVRRPIKIQLKDLLNRKERKEVEVSLSTLHIKTEKGLRKFRLEDLKCQSNKLLR